MNTLKKIFKDIFYLKWDLAEPEIIHENILNGSKIKGTNMTILILAIIIASVGLNLNSTAAIIGAMLISPIMGCIMAIGYGFARNDFKMSRNAFIGLLSQIIVSVGVSAIYFAFSPISTAHSELLSRINPSIWDVIIAIAGGFAGIIGNTRKEKTNVIPGVAIATALLPPLCTAGYGLGTKQMVFFFGAMYLFLINAFFIMVTSIIILKIIEIPIIFNVSHKLRKKLLKRLLILSIIIILPSIIIGTKIAVSDSIDNKIDNYIKNELKDDNKMIIKIEKNLKNREVKVAMIGPNFTNEEITNLNTKRKKYKIGHLKIKIIENNNYIEIPPIN